MLFHGGARSFTAFCAAVKWLPAAKARRIAGARMWLVSRSECERWKEAEATPRGTFGSLYPERKELRKAVVTTQLFWQPWRNSAAWLGKSFPGFVVAVKVSQASFCVILQ